MIQGSVIQKLIFSILFLSCSMKVSCPSINSIPVYSILFVMCYFFSALCSVLVLIIDDICSNTALTTPIRIHFLRPLICHYWLTFQQCFIKIRVKHLLVLFAEMKGLACHKEFYNSWVMIYEERWHWKISVPWLRWKMGCFWNEKQIL